MDADTRVKAFRGFLVGFLVTVSCWCVSAIAASGADIGCTSSDRRLQSLTVSADSLAVRPVDHLSVGQKNASISAEPAESVSKAAQPVLQLAPHIAAMLNTVFDRSEDPGATDSETDAKDEGPTAGRASQEREIIDDVLPAEVNVIVPSDDIARFQRQMYRKDI